MTESPKLLLSSAIDLWIRLWGNVEGVLCRSIHHRLFCTYKFFLLYGKFPNFPFPLFPTSFRFPFLPFPFLPFPVFPFSFFSFPFYPVQGADTMFHRRDVCLVCNNSATFQPMKTKLSRNMHITIVNRAGRHIGNKKIAISPPKLNRSRGNFAGTCRLPL